MSIAIKIENLSKQYRLGLVSTRTLSHDLNRWWKTSILGKEDPYLKVGETNVRETKGSSEYVWALRNINLEVKEGEVLGIIGKNGAGKSTLLKILSRVTAPTTGTIKARGRVASLLEVGTGFHSEMTGRENIYLNGAILGMTKAEINSKFDEIVDFAGVQRYIDTPVKRYSSGMIVRLGFAIAAHLEPDILVVDEVLAVGDADFQKKAIGKMHEVSHTGGRTILFVSHNMAAVKQLCNTGILIKDGEILFKGDQNETVKEYQKKYETVRQISDINNLDDAIGNDKIKILSFKIFPLTGEYLTISSGFEFELAFLNNVENSDLAVTFELRNIDEIIVFHHGTWLCQNKDSKLGVYKVKSKISPNIVNAGIYKFNLIFAQNFSSVLLAISDVIQFEIHNEAMEKTSRILPGLLRPNLVYKVSYVKSVY